MYKHIQIYGSSHTSQMHQLIQDIGLEDMDSHKTIFKCFVT